MVDAIKHAMDQKMHKVDIGLLVNLEGAALAQKMKDMIGAEQLVKSGDHYQLGKKADEVYETDDAEDEPEEA